MSPKVNEHVRHIPTGWKGTVVAVHADNLREVVWDLLGAPEGVQAPPGMVSAALLEILETVEDRYRSNPDFTALVEGYRFTPPVVANIVLEGDLDAFSLQETLEDFGSHMVVIDGLPAAPAGFAPTGLHRAPLPEDNLVIMDKRLRDKNPPKKPTWDDPIHFINKPYPKD